MSLFSNTARTGVRPAIFAIAVAAALGNGAAQAAEVVTQVTGISLTEKLARNIKVTHNGPFVPHTITTKAGGKFTLEATLQGVDFTKIGPQSYFVINVKTAANQDLDIGALLFTDPKYELGDRKAKFELKTDDEKVGSASVSFDILADTMTVTVKGKYYKLNVTPMGSDQTLGYTVLGDEGLAEPNGTVSGTSTVEVKVADSTGQPMVKGTGTMAWSRTASQGPNEPEVGLPKTSKISVDGASAP